jgi:hypothetical protein
LVSITLATRGRAAFSLSVVDVTMTCFRGHTQDRRRLAQVNKARCPISPAPGVEEVLGTGDGRCDFFEFDVFAGKGRVFKLVVTPT